MSKLVLFSDPHCHAFRQYAAILPSGQNSRLVDAVNCISQVCDLAVAVGAEAVLFGGDLFHVRKNIAVSAFNLVYEQMARFVANKIPVVMIHGNHDQVDRAGSIHAVHAFRAFHEVVDAPSWIFPIPGRPDVAVMAIPYIENVPQLHAAVTQPCPEPEAHKLLLGHVGVKGAKLGADFVYTNPHDIEVNDLRPDLFDQVFLGHYHIHQQLAPNAWYIGAPLQHNWGDRGQVRGAIVYDTDTSEVEFVPLKSPRFVECTKAEADTADLADCFVRVVAKTELTRKELDALKEKTGARHVESIFPVKKQKAVTVAARLQIDPSMAPEEVIEKYMQSGLASLDGLDESYLLQMGREILEEVGAGG